MQQLERQRVAAMLHLQHAGGKDRGVIPRQHRDHALNQDRAAIDLGTGQMHGATMRLNPGGKGAGVGVQAREAR